MKRKRRLAGSPKPLGGNPRVGLLRYVLRVVIVNYRQWSSTKELVRNLAKSDAFQAGKVEIVVVDNGSPQNPLAEKLNKVPNLRLIQSEHNRGFARAVNTGAEGFLGDWFLLLNPDITVGDGFLDRVLASGEISRKVHPNLGVIGFGMLDPEGSIQPSTGPFPSFTNTLFRQFLPRRLRKYHLSFRKEGPVDWTSGCCLLISKGCWSDLGRFDPDFFLYYEDVDFCHRATQGGWRICLDRSVTAVHHHPLHRRKVPGHLRVATRMALHTYSRKHWPAWQHRIMGLIMRLEAGLGAWSSRLRGNWAAEAWWTSLGTLLQDSSRGKTATSIRRLFALLGTGELHRKG